METPVDGIAGILQDFKPVKQGGSNIRSSSIDCRLAFMGKWFKIDQNGLHDRFSHSILDRNTMSDIGMWLFSVPSRLLSLPHSCCRCTGLPTFLKRVSRKTGTFF